MSQASSTRRTRPTLPVTTKRSSFVRRWNLSFVLSPGLFGGPPPCSSPPQVNSSLNCRLHGAWIPNIKILILLYVEKVGQIGKRWNLSFVWSAGFRVRFPPSSSSSSLLKTLLSPIVGFTKLGFRTLELMLLLVEKVGARWQTVNFFVNNKCRI